THRRGGYGNPRRNPGSCNAPRPVGFGIACATSRFRRGRVLPGFAEKAAVLTVRLAKNHPLPDGNKRLAWQALTLFCALNSYELLVPADDAVALMLGIASGELDEAHVVEWLEERLRAVEREE
ncbi:MAG: type II toxin-antitoxin system death-on-curing family toxin, partial [Acidimicrobiia bacterium]|nr:type II toxin-antitoxin system death-on-curing family toxin [Acidimicrobiia bacterium]